MSRNPVSCPHNVLNYDTETEELFCEDCGDVIEPDPDWDYEQYKESLERT